MSDFMEKYQRLKEKDGAARYRDSTLDPVERRKLDDKLNALFTRNIVKTVFDYDARQDLIADFKALPLVEKRAFLLKEFQLDPDLEPDPKPGELKEELQMHDESKRDLKVPVCRKCKKPHNPFDPCFG